MQDKEMLVYLAEREGNPKGRCKDCAFRHGTDANNDTQAVKEAMESTFLEIPFYCHTDDLKPQDFPCRGYLEAAKQVNIILFNQ